MTQNTVIGKQRSSDLVESINIYRALSRKYALPEDILIKIE
jgi:hypothetical protein